MSFKLTVLGTSSATPTLSRRPSAQALVFKNRTFLLDCGEGTQLQCLKYGVKMFKIERIFISHFHADHYLGLMGLLSTLALKGRTQEIYIYGPEGLQELIETQLRLSEAYLTYPIHFIILSMDGTHTIYEDKFLEIKSIPLAHRISCWGFLFKQRQPYRKIDKEALKHKNVPVAAFKALVYGRDYIDESGKVYSAKELTYGLPMKSYAYITDTLYMESVAQQLQGTDMIYHEATFLHELYENAIRNFHATALQAATFAQVAATKQLLIGHFSARYDDLQPLLDEARSVFPNTLLAEEGKSYET